MKHTFTVHNLDVWAAGGGCAGASWEMTAFEQAQYLNYQNSALNSMRNAAQPSYSTPSTGQCITNKIGVQYYTTCN